MTEERRVEFRLKLGEYELEIKGSPDDVRELLDLAMEYAARRGIDKRVEVAGDEKEALDEDLPPPLEISDKESVTSILSKLFSTKWASKPRSLKEVMEVLEVMGVHHPKSTVAVSLARLVKRNVIRRLKKEGVYLYVPVKPPRED